MAAGMKVNRRDIEKKRTINKLKIHEKLLIYSPDVNNWYK